MSVDSVGERAAKCLGGRTCNGADRVEVWTVGEVRKQTREICAQMEFPASRSRRSQTLKVQQGE